MILLKDVVDILIAGDGSQQASLVNIDGGQFNPARVNKVISLTNAALADIYKRFLVAYDTIAIQTTRGTLDYELSANNEKNNLNPNGFILNKMDKPIFAITGLASQSGRQLRLNEQNNQYFKRYHADHGNEYEDAEHTEYSFMLTNYRTLRVPRNLESSIVVVYVRTGHPIIPMVPESDINSFDLTGVEIDLPYTYVNALAYYILHRIANARGGETIGRGIFHEGNNYNQKYIDECTSLKQSTSEIEPIADMNLSLHRKGFV